MYKKKHCSPKNKDNSVTCFSMNSLKKIAKAYNKKHNDKIIIPKNNNEESRLKLWKSIEEKFKKYTPCSEDFCLLKNTKLNQGDLIADIEQDFRPEMPEEWLDNPKKWLSTIDIHKVMSQYMSLYPDFMFIGPVPIDFDHQFSFGRCVSDQLCKIDLEKLYDNDIRKIGIVFNLDPHYKEGSHWVCMYIDLNTGGIYYIDSVGHIPPNEIKTLMGRLQYQGNKMLLKNKILPSSLDKIHSVSLDMIPLDSNKINIKNIPNNLTIQSNTPCVIIDDLNNVYKFNSIENISGNIIILRDPINMSSKKCLIHSFKSFYNKTRFQYLNTECGIYTMFFLEQFLKGKRYNDIVANIISDEEVHNERWRYYRPFVPNQ